MPPFAAVRTSTNSQLIASLASNNNPWYWQELQHRLAGGTLSPAEVSRATDQLIAFENNQKTTQPLTWSNQFLIQADAAGDIPAPQYMRLGRAFFKPITVYGASQVRPGGMLQFGVHPSTVWQLPGVQYIYALRSITIGQVTLPIRANRIGADAENADYLSASGPMDLSGRTKLEFAPGDYQMVFTVDVALLPSSNMTHTIYTPPGQSSKWTNARASWIETITRPIKVVLPEKAIDVSPSESDLPGQ